MKALKSIPLSFYTILLTGIILIWVSSNYNWGNHHPKGILKSDACGYYAYLPAVFIYGDINFNFLDTLISNPQFPDNLKFDYREKHGDLNINKFYAGTALMQLPFFGAGYLLTKPDDPIAAGYGGLYQVLIQLSTIMYLLGSMIIIRKLLRLYQASEVNISIILLVLVFGTNVFHYTVSEPGMSHIYSLFCISLFLVLLKRYFITLKPGYWVSGFAILGLIILIRPVNIIIIGILPFIARTMFDLKKGLIQIIKRPAYLTLSIVLFMMIISIQALIYKLQAGDFLIYSYKEEGFNFLQPHFWDILFSYRKGLFIYTPVLFLILFFGSYKLFKTGLYQFITWAGFFILVTWILSSWHMWYYGGSFSSRVYIEYYPLFGILLGILLRDLKNRGLRKILIALLFLLIIICQIQTYQYRTGRIHWSEMNKGLYWDNFLRIDKLF